MVARPPTGWHHLAARARCRRSRSAPRRSRLLEMTAAYARLRQRRHAASRPHGIERIRTATGKVLYQRARRRARAASIDAAHVAHDERDAARDVITAAPARAADRRLAGRRQDRHHPGLPRRLVRRLHGRPRHRRLGRQRRQFADPQDHGRRAAGRGVEPLHEGRASGRPGRRIAGRTRGSHGLRARTAERLAAERGAAERVTAERMVAQRAAAPAGKRRRARTSVAARRSVARPLAARPAVRPTLNEPVSPFRRCAS